MGKRVTSLLHHPRNIKGFELWHGIFTTRMMTEAEYQKKPPNLLTLTLSTLRIPLIKHYTSPSCSTKLSPEQCPCPVQPSLTLKLLLKTQEFKGTLGKKINPNWQGILINMKAFSQDQTNPFKEHPNLLCHFTLNRNTLHPIPIFRTLPFCK